MIATPFTGRPSKKKTEDFTEFGQPIVMHVVLLQNGEAADRQSKEASISGSSPAAAPAGKVTVTYWYRCGLIPHETSLHASPAVLATMLGMLPRHMGCHK